MTVLVTVPYWQTPDHVERCVRSILAQTHRDLVCLVIGDGDEPQLDIRDERLIVHSYRTNRGAYFAQDVAIWASPFEWYAIVGSDDWIEPDHIARLLAYDADMAAGAVYGHGDRFCRNHEGHTRCRGLVIRKAYEVGIYRTERYREIGGHNPAERIGQDSLTLRVMRLVAPVGATSVPTYNRLFRPGSLCTSPETDRHSVARRAMRARNRAIVADCEAIAAATPDRSERAATIRAYRDRLVPPTIGIPLTAEVQRLRAKLGVPVAA